MNQTLKKTITLLFFFIVFSFGESFNKSYSNTFADKKDNIDRFNSLKTNINNSFYILGPGDQIIINFIGLPEISGKYDILSDGNVQLPLIGAFQFSGLTIEGAKEKLMNIYDSELISPQIYLNLSKAKPLRVSIIGEVVRPGPYTLDINETNRVKGSSSSLTLKGYPRLVDALQKAGGLTLDADITNINISRVLPGNELKFKRANVDLLEMIQTGNQVNNPILFDGDVIEIKKITENATTSSLENIPNNLTPEEITLYVVGEVESPGMYKVASNTQLSQAVLIAGGPKSWRHKNKVQLLRVRRNGTVKTEQIPYSSKGFNTKKNKISLRDGDIIRVNKNLFGKSTDALGTFLPTIRDIYSLYGIYEVIN